MRSSKGRKVVMALALAFIAGTAAATQAGFERMTYRDYRFMLRDAHLAYERGNFDRAFELYKRNACSGEKSSQFALGTMYLNGEGTQADRMKATNVSCQMRAATGTNIERIDCAPPVDARTGYVEIKACE